MDIRERDEQLRILKEALIECANSVADEACKIYKDPKNHVPHVAYRVAQIESARKAVLAIFS